MDKYRQTRIVTLLLLLVLAAGSLSAAEPPLFESEVVVSDQTSATRAVALNSALREVLVRVTGDRSVLDTQAAKTLLAAPAELVQQYRYFTESGKEPPLLKLWIRFDGAAIRQTLQQQGVAFEGEIGL